MVFDSFRIDFGRFRRNAERKQQIDDQSMTSPHSLGQGFALFGQEYAAIGTARRQFFALQPSNGVNRGRMRNVYRSFPTARISTLGSSSFSGLPRSSIVMSCGDNLAGSQ
jgi:hypothetical protein